MWGKIGLLASFTTLACGLQRVVCFCVPQGAGPRDGVSWFYSSAPLKWCNAPGALLCTSSLDLLRIPLIYQKANPETGKMGILFFEPTNVSWVPEPAQGKGQNRSEECGWRNEKQDLPFLVARRRQLNSAAHGTTPVIHLHSSWYNVQEWVKQLLSLPFSNWIYCLLGRESWMAVIYSPMCCSTGVLSWGSSGIWGVKCDGSGVDVSAFSCPCCCEGSHSRRAAIQAGTAGNSFCCPGFQLLLNICQHPDLLTWEGIITDLDYPAWEKFKWLIICKTLWADRCQTRLWSCPWGEVSRKGGKRIQFLRLILAFPNAKVSFW